MPVKTSKKALPKKKKTNIKLLIGFFVAVSVVVGISYVAVTRASGNLVTYVAQYVTPNTMVNQGSAQLNVKLVKADVRGVGNTDVVYMTSFGKTALPISHGAGCTTDSVVKWCVDPKLVSEQACFSIRSADVTKPAAVRLYAHDGTYRDATIPPAPVLAPNAVPSPVWQKECITSKLTNKFQTFRIAHKSGGVVYIAGAEILDAYER